MKILIVVDMQNDFIHGNLGSAEARAIIPAIQEKIAEYKENEKNLIFFTQDTHYSNYLTTQEGRFLPVEHCIKDTYGWQITPTLDTKNGLFVEKEKFGYTDWIGQFCQHEIINHQVDSIELVGVCTDICVVSNALILKAVFPEIPVIVDANCCAGTSVEAHNAALRTMRSCQVIVKGE